MSEQARRLQPHGKHQDGDFEQRPQIAHKIKDRQITDLKTEGLKSKTAEQQAALNPWIKATD